MKMFILLAGKKQRGLLLCLALLIQLCNASEGYAQMQKITLHEKETKLSLIMEKIEVQTGLNFFFSEKEINTSKVVSIQVTNSSLSVALNKLFELTGISWAISNKQILLFNKSLTPAPLTESDKSLEGIVVDQQGEPMIGVSIQAKGTLNGAITDIDGHFAIHNVNEKSLLQFSFIGFISQNITVGAKTFLKVKMEEDTQNLEEVIVVGYGVQRKINVTGSVVQISSRDLLKASMTDVSNMLAGKLPGLMTTQTSGQPGYEQSSLTIRGAGTFNDSSPLLLVDGVSRSFNTIDPNDIESVTLLKDAASAAVYGVRAAHGVILVKTKRGSVNGRPSIRYSGSYTFSTNTRFPKFLNGPDYARWHNKARELDNNEGYFSDTDIQKMEEGDPDGLLGNTNWLDRLFKNFGVTQQHNLSMSGGSEKIQYFVSGGYMNQGGILPNTGFKRYNVRSNLDVEITKELKLSVDLTGRKENRYNSGFQIAPNNGYNPITQAIRALPIIPSEYNGFPTATGEGTRTWSPLAAINNSGFTQNNRTIFESSATLEYRIPFIKGLTAKMSFSFDEAYTDIKTFLTKYDVSKFNPINKTYATTVVDGISTTSLGQSSSSAQLLMSRPSIEYSGTFGKHAVSALILYEYKETRGRSFQASRQNYMLTALPELTFASNDTPNSIQGSSNQTKIAGYVGRLNYVFDKKYLAEFSFRYDGSYKFHKDYRWGFFPSLSAGWVISEEDFLKEALPQINKLKIRASLGELGRDNIEEFLYKRAFALTPAPSYAFGTNPIPAYSLFATNSVPSYNLSWEKTRMVNVGLELTAWNGLLSIDLDAFYKYTYDILEESKGLYPPSLASNFPKIKNSGAVSVKGFELVLGHTNKVGEVNYNLNANLTWARNKLLSRTLNANMPSWKNTIGLPLGGIYGFHAVGLYQTEEQLRNRPTGPGGIQRLGDLMYEDINGDGKIDEDDQIRIANSHTPEMFFSLIANASWKGIDINLQFQGAAVSDVITSGRYPSGTMDQTEFARAFYAGGNSPYYLVEGSWTPENTNARYPRLGQENNTNNSWTSDWWAVNSSYLRLKNAQIGYTVPQRLISKLRVQNLRVYAAGTNLFTIDQLNYMDPEMPSNNNGYYPQQRTYSIGIELTF